MISSLSQLTISDVIDIMYPIVDIAGLLHQTVHQITGYPTETHMTIEFLKNLICK